MSEKSANEITTPYVKPWGIGDVISNLYEIKFVHRSGGMGYVYQAHHRNWNIDLAIKRPRDNFFKTDKHKENFIHECENWINLGLHPHIVTCYYVRTIDSMPSIFAEYVDGGTLADWIRGSKLYNGTEQEVLKRVLDISIQLAWALQYAHEKGIVHQDIKPLNILFRKDGIVKISDFGLSKAHLVAHEGDLISNQTDVHVSSGEMTSEYCSPEQKEIFEMYRQGIPRERWPKISLQTDTWSWALTVLEIFVGGLRWTDKALAHDCLQKYYGNDQMKTSMPPKIFEILEKCFHENPNDRPTEIASMLINAYKEITGQEYFRKEPKSAELLADSLNNQAISFLDLGQQKKAEAFLDRAVNTDPYHAEAIYNKGLLLWHSARTTDEQIIRQLETASNVHEFDWRPKYFLGLTHIERGDAESAIQALEQALSLLPDDVEIQNALATAHEGIGKWRSLVKIDKFKIDDDLLDNLKKHNIPKSIIDSLRSIQGVEFCNEEDFSEAIGNVKISEMQARRISKREIEECSRIIYSLPFEKHTNGANCVCLSSGTGWALSGGNDNLVRLWDLSKWQCVKAMESHSEEVRSVAISTDGSWGLSGGGHFAGKDFGIRLWELSTGKCVKIIKGHSEFITFVSISADGLLGVSSSRDGSVRLWDLTTGTLKKILKQYESALVKTISLGELESQKYENTPIAVICPSGRWVLSSYYDVLELCELSSGKTIRKYSDHKDTVMSICVSQDERWILSGCRDGTLRLWELSTGKCVRVMYGHGDKSPDQWSGKPVSSVSMSEDGIWGLSGGYDGNVRLWELATGKCVRTFQKHIGSVFSVSISLDGRCGLSTGKDGNVRLWSLGGAGYSGNFAIVLPSSSEKVLEIEEKLYKVIEKASSDIDRGLFSNAIAEVAAFRDLPAYERNNDLLRIWQKAGEKGKRISFRNGWSIRRFGSNPSKSDDESPAIFALAMSADGKRGISQSKYSGLRLWNLEQGTHIAELAHVYLTHSICFTPDGMRGMWIDGRSPHIINITDAHEAIQFGMNRLTGLWQGIRAVLKGYGEYACENIGSISVSADSMWLVSGGNDDRVRLWDLATHKLVRTLSGHSGQVSAICISPNGQSALSGSYDQMLKLWNLATGKCLKTFNGHSGKVMSVVISPDQRWGLSGSTDMKLKLWDITTGECIRTFKGHTGIISSVAVTPDSQWGFSGSDDMTIKVWNLGTGECVKTLTGHSGPVISISISADGLYLLSGSLDGYMRVWQLDWNYEFPESVDWDKGARPYLETFLMLHRPYYRHSVKHRGAPSWNEEDFNNLLKELQYRGYGWLRADGVRFELERMSESLQHSD